MCGIAGYWGTGDERVLRVMGEALKHRGPDGSGVWQSNDKRTGFAHARLAVVELSPAGAQPMTDRSGRFTITFNGEIYNFEELRAELREQGYPFKSKSDTEVLLALYEFHGDQFLNRVEGMFALAIYDSKEQVLTLARDRMGEKPLYVATHGRDVLFA
ncbi:MAG: asparagine synthase, partial [Parcubacteria group bacterium]|nr:asparagine synthase [Parcubacteria group bacterium]